MANSKKVLRQQRALERLNANIAESMSVQRKVTYSQSMEYNKLKRDVSAAGLTHPGRI